MGRVGMGRRRRRGDEDEEERVLRVSNCFLFKGAKIISTIKQNI